VKAVIGSLIILLSLFSFNASASLKPHQIHAIQNGWHAPFSEETINEVIGIPRYNEPKHIFQLEVDIPTEWWEEPADTWMWALFWTIQVADIHSTHSGVKYDCISEANPLLPEVPKIAEMVALKTVVLVPTYSAIGWGEITRAELLTPLVLGTGVVAHNYHLVDKARKRCNLR
jgi:hypothetical protein